MSINAGKEVAAVQRMSGKELQAKYAELFGDTTKTKNVDWLRKRISWRLQAIAEGGLSERARQRATALANDADLRLSPPRREPIILATDTERTEVVAVRFKDDSRVPLPGSVIIKKYKGQDIQVRVLPKGFEYEGSVFKSLSAVAKAITGQHVNGFHFFGLGKDGGS